LARFGCLASLLRGILLSGILHSFALEYNVSICLKVDEKIYKKGTTTTHASRKIAINRTSGTCSRVGHVFLMSDAM